MKNIIQFRSKERKNSLGWILVRLLLQWRDFFLSQWCTQYSLWLGSVVTYLLALSSSKMSIWGEILWIISANWVLQLSKHVIQNYYKCLSSQSCGGRHGNSGCVPSHWTVWYVAPVPMDVRSCWLCYQDCGPRGNHLCLHSHCRLILCRTVESITQLQ